MKDSDWTLSADCTDWETGRGGFGLQSQEHTETYILLTLFDAFPGTKHMGHPVW